MCTCLLKLWYRNGFSTHTKDFLTAVNVKLKLSAQHELWMTTVKLARFNLRLSRKAAIKSTREQQSVADNVQVSVLPLLIAIEKSSLPGRRKSVSHVNCLLLGTTDTKKR